VSRVTVAAAQPRTLRGRDEPGNLAFALRAIEDAARAGAGVVCFPEGYPGPYSGPLEFQPLPDLCAAARQHRIHVVSGGLEPATSDTFFNNLYLIGPTGDVLATYRRCQPAPEAVDRVLFGRRVQPGDPPRAVETSLGRMGLLVCSEIFSPELGRLLALQGADVVYAPVGGMVYELLDAWKVLLRARAIENHFYVVTCQNLYGMEDGVATIAGPEGVLAERRDAGLLVAELDLARLEWLRTHEETLELPKPYRTIPGLLDWRRPDVYGPLAERHPGTGRQDCG
jgi:predicted amidohydrolase